MSVKRLSNSVACVPQLLTLKHHETDGIRLICRPGLLSIIIISLAPLAWYDATESDNLVINQAQMSIASIGDVQIMSGASPTGTPVEVAPTDGTAVLTLLDLTGNGYDLLTAGSTSPVTATSLGFQGVKFDGTTGVLLRALNLTGTYQGFSTYLVVKNLAPATPNLVSMSIGDTGNPILGNNGFAIQQDGSSNWDIAARTGDANPYRKGGAIPAGGHVVSAIHDFTNGTLSVTINGTTTTDTGGTLTAATPTKIALGGRTDVDTSVGNCIVAGLLIFGRALSPTEDASVLSELRTIYGVT